MIVVVFAKAPRAGRVKTRLGLTGGVAAELHVAFVRDTLALAMDAGCDVELHIDADTDAWRDLAVPRFLQADGDLGARMLAVLRRGPALIVGSDAPTLPLAHLRGLLAIEGDVALGPSEDGGYWGILARRWDERMFAGVEWSTARACEQTLAAARACGFTTALGEEWFDVDEPADLRRLAASPGSLRPRTRDLLRRLS